jgi:hypothetical protein
MPARASARMATMAFSSLEKAFALCVCPEEADDER